MAIRTEIFSHCAIFKRSCNQSSLLKPQNKSLLLARHFSIRSKLLTSQVLPNAPVRPSFLRRSIAFVGIAVVFTTVGFVMTAVPAFQAANGILNPPTDKETLALYEPDSSKAREIEDFIQNNHITLELRSKPDFSEVRPHLKMPPAMRAHSLTAGTLLGPGKVEVPPLAFCEEGGKSMVAISYLGRDLCGHPGIIHGGFLATMLDEGLARCCFAALPNKVGMTANLNINYRAPAKADSYVVLRAETTKVEGRKAWVSGRIETLVGEGETPVVIAEATALFIEPRQAKAMAIAYPTK